MKAEIKTKIWDDIDGLRDVFVQMAVVVWVIGCIIVLAEILGYTALTLTCTGLMLIMSIAVLLSHSRNNYFCKKKKNGKYRQKRLSAS